MKFTRNSINAKFVNRMVFESVYFHSNALCDTFSVIKGTIETFESSEDTDSSILMVLVSGVFKGSDSIQNKIIKINFAENLNR